MMFYPRNPNLVSVVVPNYNNAGYVEECLDSILRQTYRDWELIVVDDASTDDSKERIMKWMERNRPDRCHLLFLPINVGFAGALTIGYFMAKGEFIAVQDSDDLSHAERLAKQVKFLQDNPSVDLVGTNYASFHGKLPEVLSGQKWIQYGSRIREAYAKGGHSVCHGTIMFRGKLFDKLGGPTRRIKGAEDYEFIVKFLENQSVVENMPEILYYYRLHPKQRSREFYGGKRGGPHV